VNVQGSTVFFSPCNERSVYHYTLILVILLHFIHSIFQPVKGIRHARLSVYFLEQRQLKQNFYCFSIVMKLTNQFYLGGCTKSCRSRTVS